jgi:hypothetical protein
MPVFSTIIGALGVSASTASTVGAVASAVGTGVSVAGSFQQAAGTRKAQRAQERAEVYRQKQMEQDAIRQRMELIRQAQIQRAQSLATGVAQGAASEGSSAMPGAEGSISGQAGRGIQAVNSNVAFGNLIFDENRRAAQGNRMAAQGGTLAAAGQGLTSLGNSFVTNAERIGRIGGR